MSDTIDVKRAAASIAKMVDEFTERGWNDEGRANFATIVEHRLRRFRVAMVSTPVTSEEEGGRK